MLSGNYFYNATIKRVVSVFGTIFNNIKIARHDSGVTTNTVHVPISYGPRSKFLARIREENDLGNQKIAIKLPRMSFEMTSIDYDSGAKLNKLNKLITGSSHAENRTTQFQSVPYSIGMQLNIYAKNQDDALQIVEQILPTFTPEYTVTIKDIDGPNSKPDVPFILNSVSFQDDYEGDFTTRRAIIYTLDFTIKARFSPSTGVGKIIKRVQTQFADFTILSNVDQSPKESLLSQVTVKQDSPNDSPIQTFISFIDPDVNYKLVFDDTPSFSANQLIIGQTSQNAATVSLVFPNSDSPKQVIVTGLEGLLTRGEVVQLFNSPSITATLGSIDEF